MALKNKRFWLLAVALFVTSAACQAADLVSEPRYADITRGGSVATISQIGSNNQTQVDQAAPLNG